MSPTNGSSGISLQPTCQINANDVGGDTLTVYWYENTLGSWTLRQTDAGVAANSTVTWDYTQASAYGTTYYWKVAVNDTVHNTTAVYHFTTLTLSTSVDTISPYIVSLSPLNITATNTTAVDNVTLYYRYSKDNSTWGTKDISIFDGFESGSMNSSLWSTYQTPSSDARIQFNYGDTTQSGGNACAMDDNDADAGDYALNELFTVYDFTGASNINIDLWQYDADDEEQDIGNSWTGHADCDAVSFTNDDNTWYEVIDAASLNSNDAWSHYTYNISNDGDFDSSVNSSFAIKFQQYDNYQIDIGQNWDGRVWDDIYINFTTDWIEWSNTSNPDKNSPWSWDFDFPNGDGYYEFYSIGKKAGSPDETAPASADARCYYGAVNAPVINSYDLRNGTGSKLDNATGSLNVNSEYYFTVNITDNDGWDDIDYTNITAWYDDGNDATTYNHTAGGNLNMFLQYDNTSGTASYNMLWPDDEAQLVLGSCSETIIDSNTRVINISFIPGAQVRWASSNNTWNGAQDTWNDLYSWNFNITVRDSLNLSASKIDEYGVYQHTSVTADSDWVDVAALPGFSDDSSIVTLTYSSNYDYDLSIYFEENLTHTTQSSYYINISDNVTIKADADLGDDITSDKTFQGIGEVNAIDIFNISGTYQTDGTSQSVDVQFRVYIPLGTMGGKYTARVATKISHD